MGDRKPKTVVNIEHSVLHVSPTFFGDLLGWLDSIYLFEVIEFRFLKVVSKFRFSPFRRLVLKFHRLPRGESIGHLEVENDVRFHTQTEQKPKFPSVRCFFFPREFLPFLKETQ